ncbi:MAG: MBL fold metallo-hydrolase [Acidimicrobiia bacterium]|nr:MBL fold metallo-hydrolase [Acidimicrobiia bacterium]
MVRVTITGSGTPLMIPGRAGPGVLVEVEPDVKLQFDCGRATTLRLTEAGVKLPDITAVFLTHHHSDHMVGLPDLAMSYWLEQWGNGVSPLEVVAPLGPAADYAARALDLWDSEMTIRAAHTGRTSNASISVSPFAASDSAQTVFESGDVRVTSVAVRHEPVVPAVAYRVEAPAGSVVISGDTAVCPTLESLAGEATVLVQEVFRSKALPEGMLSDPKSIGAYHSDVTQVGEMAARAGVGTLLLTHVIPPPTSPQAKVDIVNDIRRAGYRGPVIVADDLNHVDFSPHNEQ